MYQVSIGDEHTSRVWSASCVLGLGAGGGLSAALQPHEHHDVALSLLELVGLHTGVEQVVQLLDHHRLDHAPLVVAGRLLAASR